ncbi:MAG: cytochrome P450 [Gammaproteobacteria bacterium]|nr:cytochrome P450 [Gammaproteobacteria bacterium]
MTLITTPSTLPPGPAEPYDMQTNAASFAHLSDWVGYGDILYIKPQQRKAPTFVLNHPDYVKHVLVGNHANYHKGVGFERVKMLLGNGIIVSDGPFWRRQRRRVQPAFDRSVIAGLADEIKHINLRLLARWQDSARNHEVVNITAATNDLALEIVLRAIFSDDFDRLLAEQGTNPFACLVDDNRRDLKLAVKFRALTKLVAEVIARRRQSKRSKQDFLGIMLATTDKDSRSAMLDKELIDEVMTLIVAGSETSATTMNWTWYVLAVYPEIAARFYAEIDAASFSAAPEYLHLPELDYSRQIIEEVLRLYPPVWLYSRKALGEDRLGDYVIPAGADIFISPYYLHRLPQFWPQPELFDPARFSEAAIKARHKFVYIPFSAGPRRCIGDFFALVEAQLHFGLMGRHFRMEYLGERVVELAPEVNLRSKHPLMMRIHER